MSNSSIIWTGFGVECFIAVAVMVFGTWFKRIHFWKGDHLQEVGAQVIYQAVVGLVLSYLFSFHGGDQHLAAVSSALFLTFLVPLLSLGWISDWPSERMRNFSDRHRANPWLGFGCFVASMLWFGVAVYFACLNSSLAAQAGQIGLVCAGAAFCLLCLGAAFAGRSTAAG
jgi:hypothetical protein